MPTSHRVLWMKVDEYAVSKLFKLILRSLNWLIFFINTNNAFSSSTFIVSSCFYIFQSIMLGHRSPPHPNAARLTLDTLSPAKKISRSSHIVSPPRPSPHPTPPCRRGHPLSHPNLCSPIMHSHGVHRATTTTGRRLSLTGTSSPTVGRRHHDRRTHILQMHVSKCLKCFIGIL
jgi:hypothetical protein